MNAISSRTLPQRAPIPERIVVAYKLIPDDTDQLPPWQETDIGRMAQYKHWYNEGYVDLFQKRIKDDKGRVVKIEWVSIRRKTRAVRTPLFNR